MPSDYYIYAMVDDGVSAPVLAYADGLVTITSNTTISARHLFYNGSTHDGNNAAANSSDDAAIATDKTALLPGETASFANYSSYSRDTNGIMVDIASLSGVGLREDHTLVEAGRLAWWVGVWFSVCVASLAWRCRQRSLDHLARAAPVPTVPILVPIFADRAQEAERSL